VVSLLEGRELDTGHRPACSEAAVHGELSTLAHWLPDLARAAGYGEVHQVATIDDLSHVLRLALTAPPSRGWMLHCRGVPAHAARSRVELELPDIFKRPREYLSSGRPRLGTEVRA
jgi:hypothetical protein